MTRCEPIYSLKGKRIWIAGHNGMVGSALLRRLAQVDCTLLTVARDELDLTRQADVEAWMKRQSRRPFSWLRLKWAASWLMTGGQPSSSTTISPSRPM